jgi:hypothetical protein
VTHTALKILPVDENCRQWLSRFFFRDEGSLAGLDSLFTCGIFVKNCFRIAE